MKLRLHLVYVAVFAAAGAAAQVVAGLSAGVDAIFVACLVLTVACCGAAAAWPLVDELSERSKKIAAM